MDVPSHSLHIAMFPWFAMGHYAPYIHLSNKLAKKGHKISFFIPKRTLIKVQHHNLHPHLITFVPLTVPHIDGLPHDAETTSDVPFSLFPLIATAMDRTQKDIELLLKDLKPKIVFFDFQHWLPSLTQKLGIKSLQYWIVNPISIAYFWKGPRKNQVSDSHPHLTEDDLMKPPPGFPDEPIKLYPHELKFLASSRKLEWGSGVLLYDRLHIGTSLSDAIGFKGCIELDGPYAEYLGNVYKKPALLSGPLLPEKPITTLEENWVSWLARHKASSVVFCAYGSEGQLQLNQFQELLLGLELTGYPFIAALKAPIGFESIEEAIPEGLSERVKERGIVYGGWIQQQLILEHSSVGCFITHCGAASITEGLVNTCQLVFLPRVGADHITSARMMSTKFKVGVEVEKGAEDGLFTRESLCRAVKSVMDEGNEVEREVRENHSKLRNFLLSNDLESSCIDSFCHKLHDLV